MRDNLHIVAVPRRFVNHDWGGVETYILETGQGINAMGHRLEVICPSIFSDVCEEEIGGIHVARTPYFYPYWNLSESSRLQMDKVGGNLFSYSLLRTLRKIPTIDLIHLHTGNRVGGIVRTVAKGRHIPYVVTLHGGHFTIPQEEFENLTRPAQSAYDWGKVLGWWVGAHRVLNDAAAVFCVSRKEQQAVRARFPEKRVEYLPNGVNVKKYEQGDGLRFRRAYGISDSARLLVTVARIAPQKNQLLLVRALPELRRRNPDVHVALVGSVNREDYYQQLIGYARDAGVADALTIVPGLMPEDPLLVDAYHAADVFVLPSIHEPFGIAILEAWAAGRPVIASRVGGIPDFLDDGVDGLLFEPDDVESFVRTYESLTPERSQSICQAASKKVGQYNWDEITRQLVVAYKTITNCYPKAHNPLSHTPGGQGRRHNVL